MAPQVVIFEVDIMSASGHHASMKMQDPFCSGRCLTEPVFVSSSQQRGTGPDAGGGDTGPREYQVILDAALNEAD